MDGVLRLGNRKLAIEFDFDRHSVDRIESAYQRLATSAAAASPQETSVQTVPLSPSVIPERTTETQG